MAQLEHIAAIEGLELKALGFGEEHAWTAAGRHPRSLGGTEASCARLRSIGGDLFGYVDGLRLVRSV